MALAQSWLSHRHSSHLLNLKQFVDQHQLLQLLQLIHQHQLQLKQRALLLRKLLQVKLQRLRLLSVLQQHKLLHHKVLMEPLVDQVLT